MIICFRKQNTWNNDPSLFSPEVNIQYWLVHRDWGEDAKYFTYWRFHGFHNIQRWNPQKYFRNPQIAMDFMINIENLVQYWKLDSEQ